MKIVVCVKEVPDADAVHALAIGGRLRIDQEEKTVVRQGIPLLMNAYDEQAIEAALRLRDAGVDCSLTVLTINSQGSQQLFLRAFSLGADEGYHLEDPAFEGADASATAYTLFQAIQHLGGADLILCGRQGSDYDQGVVGPGIAALLHAPCVTLARDLQVTPEGKLRVTRVLPDGEDEVEVSLPGVVTITNELGQPRFPKLAAMMAARKKQPTTLSAADIGADPGQVGAAGARVQRTQMYIPEVQGRVEWIPADDLRQAAAALLERLRADRIL